MRISDWSSDVCSSDLKHPCGARVATRSGLHKLAQGLIPAAGVGVFLGLSATTLTLLQHEGVSTGWATTARFAFLGLALLWSLRLVWRLTGLRTESPWRRGLALSMVALGVVPFRSEGRRVGKGWVSTGKF